jgi:uncharacterized OB-fold protein
MAQSYVLPYISKYTRPFWDGLLQDKLLAQECTRCTTQFFPARSRCPNCLSKDYKWIELSGEGTLYSWSQVLFLPPKPYVMGVVELKEHIGRSVARINVAPENLAIDQRVRANFVKFKDSKLLEWIPY